MQLVEDELWAVCGGHKRALVEALSQALRMEAAKVARKPPVKLWVVKLREPKGPWSPRMKCDRTDMLAVWWCRGIIGDTADRDPPEILPW
jgi:hypothetical protein